jgi:hypothetical protein
VQWDTSDHDWLEGRGEEILLINMIDDATSRWFARFVVSDSTVENMNLLERYVQKHGRPLAYYTDKASIFQTAEKTKRDGSRLGKSREELPPTQIGRVLQELAIPWIAAHSPQAKGRVERGFLTAQDRLVKGLRVARWREPTTTWKPSSYRGSTPRWRWCLPMPTMLTGPWRNSTIWPRFSVMWRGAG